MKTRSLEAELIDLGPKYYTKEEYADFLYKLDLIGKYLGSNRSMLNKFNKLKDFDSVLDVGCGGGMFTTVLAQNFPNARILGIDIDSNAIDYAQNQKQSLQKKGNLLNNLNFEIRTKPELNEKEKSVDTLTCSLLFHHLSDEQIINFLKKAEKIARKSIIINDLHRNWVSYFGFSIISKLFFKNRLICNDGLLSIKKSFKRKDLIYYLRKAKLSNYKISWHFPFRWIVIIYLKNGK